jgi:hypothetical protein
MCVDFIHSVLMDHLKYSVCVDSKTSMSHISLFSDQSVGRTRTPCQNYGLLRWVAMYVYFSI